MQRFPRAKNIIILLLTWAFILLPVFVSAENETQTQLEQELQNIEQQIEQYSKDLAVTRTQKTTLANKIKELQTKQKALNLQIKATTLKLTSLSGQIDQAEDGIKTNLTKEQAINIEIAAILRRINSTDDNFLISLLSARGLSSIFNEIKNYTKLTNALKNLQEQLRNIRIKLAEQKMQLEDQKNDANSLLQLKSIQQEGLKGTLGEQNQLMTKTKGLESNYQAMLADSKKRAADIRSRIYELFNTGKQINFGQAVDIAKWASGLTGVRPAFLLAVLTQESNLGKNVGTCNRAGDPPEKSWKIIMKPERDQEPFQQITKDLGLNIDTTPVSCPMRDKQGNQIGWGGAMGPAQFIPSTWMGYTKKVSALSGKTPANPWDIRDAFLAAAIKLKGDGADGTNDGDWKAAMRYFAGSVNLKYRFYGDNVIATTNQYLQDIEELK